MAQTGAPASSSIRKGSTNIRKRPNYVAKGLTACLKGRAKASAISAKPASAAGKGKGKGKARSFQEPSGASTSAAAAPVGRASPPPSQSGASSASSGSPVFQSGKSCELLKKYSPAHLLGLATIDRISPVSCEGTGGSSRDWLELEDLTIATSTCYC
ncbi:hypothetical protein OC834_007402 [Tilletia horrida]|nr:hypothetical protein OC834_007402 [Tilletia horrida]